MRFEHLIEINSPSASVQTVVPPFSRAQLWQGLMIRVQTPQRFPMGPDACVCRELEPSLMARQLQFGQHVFTDEVQWQAEQSVVFTPQAQGDTTPVRLSIYIEEPQAGLMLLRFVYEALGTLSQEEAHYSDYRHNAWLHNDRDMVRTLRQWLVGEGL